MANNVRWLADLSKIAFDNSELEDMERDMVSIMELMDSLKKIDLPETNTPVKSASLELLRKDEPGGSLDPALLVSQCSIQKDGCFSILKIVE